ncbi:MAG: hypothetical protein BAJATHORv1_20050 [Candidatus Thorarchaeota archaeon]|nr:MAG: hypothetical protein BAJATHORv1_20050 [Candidatus Thorarchaeota archaeon]
MNAEQKRMIQAVMVILGCFSIYTYTVNLEVHHYCDWTGLKIEERFGHEVTFSFQNGTIRHYACVNVSLLAFEYFKSTGDINQLENIQIRCAMCGMLMDWNDPMNVWVYEPTYLCPTTGNPTIVVLCEDSHGQDLCESHFLDQYGGQIISNPYEW